MLTWNVLKSEASYSALVTRTALGVSVSLGYPSSRTEQPIRMPVVGLEPLAQTDWRRRLARRHDGQPDERAHLQRANSIPFHSNAYVWRTIGIACGTAHGIQTAELSERRGIMRCGTVIA